MTETTIKQRFARIAELLKSEDPPAAVRREIYELVADVIDYFEKDLDYWEKLHIGSAINSLAHNLGGGLESRIWLSYCMANLAAAFVPKTDRNDGVPPKDPEVDRITAADLREALKSLAPQL
jgi:hypothetical protein